MHPDPSWPAHPGLADAGHERSGQVAGAGDADADGVVSATQVPSIDDTVPRSAGFGPWVGYLAMCLGMFMAILDIQIVASSLLEIQAGPHIPLDALSWVQTAYLIAEIIAIPLTGWLTCLLSLRRLFLIAVIAFTLASAGCAES